MSASGNDLEHERRRIKAEHSSWIGTIVKGAAGGALIGVLVAAALLWLNVANLRTLILAADRSFAYGALFTYGFAHLFAMVVCGSAIWMRAQSEAE